MKALTRNLVFFAIGLAILTLLFRFGLSYFLQNNQFTLVWVISPLYGIGCFMIGWIFGKKDNLSLPLYDIGFRFHLTTYLICNIIAKIWYTLGYQSKYENVKVVHLTIIVWGVVLAVHFIIYLITRKNAINGIRKSELFE